MNNDNDNWWNDNRHIWKWLVEPDKQYVLFVHPRCQIFYNWETQKVVEATEKKLLDLGFMPWAEVSIVSNRTFYYYCFFLGDIYNFYS